MARILKAIILLALSAIVFSGCGGASSEPAAGPSSSTFPKMPAGLADAEFTLLDGTKFKITDHKGKVLMLNIWGTWCGPCRQEIPHLIEMKNKYGSHGFEVLGLNIGDNSFQPESDDQINGFARQMGINYVIARSPRPATVQFYAVTQQQVVPQTMLIDREGRIRNIFVGGGANVFNSMKRQLDKVMTEQPG